MREAVADKRVGVEVTANDKATPILRGLSTELGGLKGLLGSFGGKAAGMFTVAGAAALVAKGLNDSVQSAMQAELAVKKVGSVIRATGGAAGYTTAEMGYLAESLQRVTRFSDEASMEALSVLLTFKNLGRDVLPVVLERAMDLSTLLGMDLTSSARLLGRALDDPAENMGVLSRVLGEVSPEIAKTIEGFATLGDRESAQAELLDLLSGKFGGMAKDAGTTTAGQLDIMRNAVDNVGERIGALVTGPLARFANWVVVTGLPAVDAFGASLDGLLSKRVLLGGTWGVGDVTDSMKPVSSHGPIAPLPIVGAEAWLKAQIAIINNVMGAGIAPSGPVLGPEVPISNLAGRWGAMQPGLASFGKSEDAVRAYRAIIQGIAGPDGASGLGGGGFGGGAASRGFPDILASAFGGNLGAAQGWMGAFAGEHGGRGPSAVDVRDKLAGDLFAQKYGRAATQGEWEQRYYKGSFEGMEGEESALDKFFGEGGTLMAKMDEERQQEKENMDALIAAFKRETDKTLTVQFAGTRITDPPPPPP